MRMRGRGRGRGRVKVALAALRGPAKYASVRALQLQRLAVDLVGGRGRVRVGIRDRVGVGVRIGVRVRTGVRVRVGVRVKVRVRVRIGVRVRVRVRVLTLVSIEKSPSNLPKKGSRLSSPSLRTRAASKDW